MDLVFRHDGILRQGDDYSQFATFDPAHPWVFVSKDESEFFLLKVDSCGNYSIEPIDARQCDELRRKSRRRARLQDSGTGNRRLHASGDRGFAHDVSPSQPSRGFETDMPLMPDPAQQQRGSTPLAHS